MQSNVSLLLLLNSILVLANPGCTADSGNQKSHYRLSSRFFYPASINGHPSTVDVLDKLKPDYIEWTYNYSAEALNAYNSRGIKYSIAMNPQIPDSLGYTTGKLSIKKLSGDLYVAPWMKDWKINNPFWGCVNNPGFYNLFLNRGLQIAGLGAYAIIVDDALFNARLKDDGHIGCFCDFCISLFYDNLEGIGNSKTTSDNSWSLEQILSDKKSFFASDSMVNNYIAFQRNSVVKFLVKWMSDIRVKYPEILFYTNNFRGQWNDIYINFDGGIAELSEEYIEERRLDRLYAVADSLNKFQIFTLSSENYDLQRKLMDYNARHKKVTLLPWDIYITGNRRYYMSLDNIRALQKGFQEKYTYK